jgi:hypothetical protein
MCREARQQVAHPWSVRIADRLSLAISMKLAPDNDESLFPVIRSGC